MKIKKGFIILFFAILHQGQAQTHPDGEFYQCDCPNVNEDPDIQVPEESACPKANQKLAEIVVTRDGDKLVATSLNIDLWKLLDGLSVEEQGLPLTVVSDIVRILRPTEVRNPMLTIQARKVMMASRKYWRGLPVQLEVLPETTLTIFANEVENGPIMVKKNVLEPSPGFSCDLLPKSAIHQLLEHFEYAIVTGPSTFDDIGGECKNVLQNIEVKDLLWNKFAWMSQLLEECSDATNQFHLQLLRKYRGPMTEGDLMTLVMTDRTTSYNEFMKSATSKLNEVVSQSALLEADLYKQWEAAKPSILKLSWSEKTESKLGKTLSIVDGLFNGNFEAIAEDRQSEWLKKLLLIEKAEKSMLILSELKSGQPNNQIGVLEVPHTVWPKEWDFVDIRELVTGLFYDQDESGQIVKRSWLSILHGMEKLYHLRNLEAALSLETTLYNLSQGSNLSRQRQEVESNKLPKATPKWDTVMTRKLTMKDVPAHLLAAGLIEKQIWPSHQQFNDLSHLRVVSAKVLINGLDDVSFKLESINSLFHDLDIKGRHLAFTGFPVSFPGSSNEHTTPFNRWRLVPSSDFKLDSLKGHSLVDLTLDFELSGVYIEGLTGLADDVVCPTDDVAEFTKCKYEGKVPFYGAVDIVTAMSLPEINHLLEAKYQAQESGQSDEGVITEIITDWTTNIAPPYCVDFPPIPPYMIQQRVQMVARLHAPRIIFPQGLEGYMRLTYSLSNAYINQTVVMTDCDGENPRGHQSNITALSGTLKIVVPLSKIDGEVDEDGKVLLNFRESAINSDDFTFENPVGKDELFKFCKEEFIKLFKQTELTRIKYDPQVTPTFVQPEKFIFITFCAECQEVPEDDGYLITYIKTKSPNSKWLGHPTDPASTGLDHACPKDYNAVIFLASHITMCDIYLNSFQTSDSQLEFAVHRDVTPEGSLILKIEYLTDMCIRFSEPEQLAKNEVQVHIYHDFFSFTPHTGSVKSSLDNARGSPGGQDIGLLLTGYYEVCTDNCDKWYNFLNPFSNCFVLTVTKCLLNCFLEGQCSYNEDAWSKGKLRAHGESEVGLVFEPECFLFQFPQMDFKPTIEFKLESDNSHDREARENAERRIRLAMENKLRFSTSQSPSVSLFAAVNLLFPGQKIIQSESKAFFSPGPVIMYGNIVQDYIPCESIILPEICGTTLQC